MPRNQKIISQQEALLKAQDICAKYEKCEYDIRQKLYEWKVNTEQHNYIIDLLKKESYIDDQRYAVFFTKDKFKFSKWGKIKIEFALKQKHISSGLIKNALDEISENDYDELLKKELEKKLNTIKDADEYTIKSKLVRFGLSRGFENGKVFDMVSSIIENKKNE